MESQLRKDQASKLREIADGNPPLSPPTRRGDEGVKGRLPLSPSPSLPLYEERGGAGASREGRIIAITSGKGGVGKSNFALNLAIALSRLGRRVLLFDADINLANIDILLGMSPRYTLRDVILEGKDILDTVVEGPSGIRIVPACSGAADLLDLDGPIKERLMREFEVLQSTADILLVDTAAGLSQNVMDFILSADEVIVMTTPEPTAITDAYAMVKVIAAHASESGQKRNVPIKLLINFVRSRSEAEEIFEKLSLVITHFLNLSVENLGFLVIDKNIPRAVEHQSPFLLSYPTTAATVCIHSIARRIINDGSEPHGRDKAGSLLHRIFERRAT